MCFVRIKIVSNLKHSQNAFKMKLNHIIFPLFSYYRKALGATAFKVVFCKPRKTYILWQVLQREMWFLASASITMHHTSQFPFFSLESAFHTQR